MEDCIFCKIVAGQIPSWTIFENEQVKAFMDINPVTDGHLLVIPKRHAAHLWEIAEADAREVMAAAVRLGNQVRRALAPAGINLLQCTGKAAGQDVFHFHMHVIPRYEGDGVTMPWTPQRGDPAHIAAVAEKIRAAAE